MPLLLKYEKTTGYYSKRFMGKDNGQEGRKYARYRHTPEEKLFLRQHGFISVNSSNVSAVAKQDGDLYIRFHGGELYKYIDADNHLEPMLKAPSKGRYVWNALRRPRVPYTLVGSLPIPNEKTIEIEKDIDEYNPPTDTETSPEVLNSDLNDDKLHGNASIKVINHSELQNYQSLSKQQKSELRKKVLTDSRYAITKINTNQEIVTIEDVVKVIGSANIINTGYGYIFTVGD